MSGSLFGAEAAITGPSPDWRYRADQARREWFTPADWNTLRLPDALFWLYPLLRPVGWLVRRWRRSGR